jgi:hypothetical protein
MLRSMQGVQFDAKESVVISRSMQGLQVDDLEVCFHLGPPPPGPPPHPDLADSSLTWRGGGGYTV